MNTNLAHDVFIKKAESLKLAADVEEFLKAKGLSKPVQIPPVSTSTNKYDFNQSKFPTLPKSKSGSLNERPRREAQEKGLTKFEGTGCLSCGNTTRYTSNCKCVACTLRTNSLRDKRSFKGI